jgi:hypothetical protein
LKAHIKHPFHTFVELCRFISDQAYIIRWRITLEKKDTETYQPSGTAVVEFRDRKRLQQLPPPATPSGRSDQHLAHCTQHTNNKSHFQGRAK